ncbi:cytochrome P450 [Artomyces pyxidatus]|uniref:Cytochrome P450 n=1 Tax=Artomyces pyxidatus TaxID=48021 RepID=A0ACB8SGK1_9AGAM|nr:cytochrome P450 [Artomyces pyxidatus]
MVRPVIYMSVFGRQFVMLNTHKAVNDLLEKRAAKYCHRPRLVMAAELVGRNTMLFTNYNALYKEYRRILSTFSPARMASKYWTLQEAESLKFVANLQAAPQDVIEHVRTSVASVILRLLYGLDIKSKHDPFVQLAEAHSHITTLASAPGRWLVDSFPVLRHVPVWFPGAHFRRWALDARRQCEEFTLRPHNTIKAALAAGSAVPSWTSEHLFTATGEPVSAHEEEVLRGAAASLYSGGSDTNVSVMCAFFRMMSLHPEVQSKARDELERATNGGKWLPTMKDRDACPYIQCIIKELLRFNPVVPLVPHSLVEDDEYEGYTIPKGAWVMANIWALMHDPAVYPAPDAFQPERFEGAHPQRDPLDICFGFGRRTCPGTNFALASLFLNMAHVLFACEIAPAKGEARFTDGHVSHPVPFDCTVLVRDEERAAWIKQAAAEGI